MNYSSKAFKKYKKQAITNARIFLNEPNFYKIVDFCRLVPDKDNWKYWYDESGNKLILYKKPKIKLRPIPIPFTNNIYKRSNLRTSIYFTERAFLAEHAHYTEVVLLQNLDDLQYYHVYKSGIIEKYEPLLLGYDKLKFFANNFEFGEIETKEKWPEIIKAQILTKEELNKWLTTN